MVPTHDDNRLSTTKGGKSIAVILLGLAVAGAAVGFYLYNLSSPALSKDKDKEEETELISQLWLMEHFGTIKVDDEVVGGLYSDPDNDGLNNYQEYIYVTNPKNSDTDGDGVIDGLEVAYNLDPLDGLLAGESYDAAQQDLKDAGIEVSTDDIKKIILDNIDSQRPPYIRQWNKDQIMIVNDNSKEAKDTYKQSFLNIITYFEQYDTQALIENYFTISTGSQIDNFINNAHDVVDSLRELTVPSDLADWHLAHLRLSEGYLGLAVAAKEGMGKENFDEGSMYPEIQYLAQLEPALRELATKFSAE